MRQNINYFDHDYYIHIIQTKINEKGQTLVYKLKYIRKLICKKYVRDTCMSLPSDIINKLSIFWEKSKAGTSYGLPNQINIF